MVQVHIQKSISDTVRTKAALSSSNMWDFTDNSMSKWLLVSYGLQVLTYIAKV